MDLGRYWTSLEWKLLACVCLVALHCSTVVKLMSRAVVWDRLVGYSFGMSANERSVEEGVISFLEHFSRQHRLIPFRHRSGVEFDSRDNTIVLFVWVLLPD